MTLTKPFAVDFGALLVHTLIMCAIAIGGHSSATAQDPSPAQLLEQSQKLADEPSQALILAERARSAAKETRNARLEVEAILTAARAHRKMKNYDLANEACLTAFEISRLIRNPEAAFAACDLASKMHYVRGRYDLAQKWEERTLGFAKEIGDLAQEAQSFNDLGVLLKRQGLIAQATENYQRALEVRQRLGDRRGEAQSLMNLGIIYKNLGDYPRALEYQLEAMTIREELQDNNALAQSYQNIGNLCGHLGDFERAVDYYRRSLTIHREMGNLGRIADSLSNMSEAYSNLGQRDDALDAIEEALANARKADNIPAVAGCLRRAGEIQADMGQLDEAEATLKEAVELSRRTNTRRTEAGALLILGTIFHRAGESEAAATALGQATEIADEIDELPTLRNAAAELASTLADLGRYNEAYDALAKSRSADNTMGKTETVAMINNLEARYTLQTKDTQIELLERDNQIQSLSIERQRWLGGFVIALLALGLAVAAAGWSRARDLKRSHRLLEEKNSEITRQQETLEAVNNALENAARQLNATNEALLASSITDGLTQVFNRKHILECIENETRRARRYGQNLAVLMIDLDHFKQVNDRFGHRSGDMVLERTASAMGNGLRGEDSIGRYGGEEFLVVLPATEIGGAFDVADRIRRSVQTLAFDDDLCGLTQTVSIGVAELEECDPKTAERLLSLADAALYAAKHEGRNRTIIATSSMTVGQASE